MIIRIQFLLALAIAVSLKTVGQVPGKIGTGAGATEVTGYPTHSALTINEVSTWSGADGSGNQSNSGFEGLYYPPKTASMVYRDCLVWGAKLFRNGFEGAGSPAANQSIRVGGGSYTLGTVRGHVLGFGQNASAVSPTDTSARIYRIRRDYYTMSEQELTFDAAVIFEKPVQDVMQQEKDMIRTQYGLDWVTWPVHLGAPYIERNGQPGYQPPPPFGPEFTVDSLAGHDEPGLAGANGPADQVMWMAYNDLSPAQTTAFSGSLPMGLEIQKTVWGYKGHHFYFTRHKMINKGGVDTSAGQLGSFWLDSMYVAQWTDPDVGSWSDDLIGYDTVRGIGFAYNANPTDAKYDLFGLAPPSVGYSLLAGPAVAASPTDTAIVDLKPRPGFRNLEVSAFTYLSAGLTTDPPFRNYDAGAAGWWKLLRGYMPMGGFAGEDSLYPHPPGTEVSKFPLSGDPVTGSGFVDGEGTAYSLPPGDRRLLVSTGPFRMAPGDTQEVTMAIALGLGADRLSSITTMRVNSQEARQVFLDNFRDVQTGVADDRSTSVPIGFTLTEAYPNPFNGIVNIRLTVGTSAHVTVNVYDLLGRQVATLVDGRMNPGVHPLQWNSRASASGVYFVKMEAEGYVDMKKVILVK